MHFGKIKITPSLYAEWLAAEVDGWAPTSNGGAQATVAFEYTADEAKEWRQIARANAERSKARRLTLQEGTHGTALGRTVLRAGPAPKRGRWTWRINPPRSNANGGPSANASASAVVAKRRPNSAGPCADSV